MGTRDTAIATLVERQTRYCQLVALPEGTNAEPVCEALKTSIVMLPVQLRRSLTWDQGKEMAAHRRFSVETGVEVYFCDPRSPWQRGSNENTNGLLRQYFPKGKSLAGVSQAELDEVARKLNDRPAKRSVPDPRRETHRTDRRAPHTARPTLISLRPTAFARQRPDGMTRSAHQGWCTDQLRPSGPTGISRIPPARPALRGKRAQPSALALRTAQETACAPLTAIARPRATARRGASGRKRVRAGRSLALRSDRGAPPIADAADASTLVSALARLSSG